MSISDEDIAFVKDLFTDIPALSTRKMFGGLSIYSNGQIFAIIGPQGAIHIKAKNNLAQDLAAEGAAQFKFEQKDGRVTRMGYWTLPDSAQDDPDQACAWARKSLMQTG